MANRFVQALKDVVSSKGGTLKAEYAELSEAERKCVSFWVFGTEQLHTALINRLAQRVTEELDAIDERLGLATPPTLEDVQVEQDAHDHRKLTRTETWSDGRTFVAHLRNDAPLFIGTHERGKSYGRGDWVVHGGSTWACMKATADSPGTNTSAWMIVARKGSDGR